MRYFEDLINDLVDYDLDEIVTAVNKRREEIAAEKRAKEVAAARDTLINAFDDYIDALTDQEMEEKDREFLIKQFQTMEKAIEAGGATPKCDCKCKDKTDTDWDKILSEFLKSIG